MNKLMLFTGILMMAGCSARAPERAPLNMQNPAAAWCVEQGGKTEIVSTDKGQTGYCTLPSGERGEAWTLYRQARRG